MNSFNPSEQQIADWLREHPDFLLEHAELLKQLAVPHASGATSLIERQIELLRSENQELRRRLEQLSSVAGENERLLRRMHRVALEIASAATLDRMHERLHDALRNEFQADAVRLALAPELAARFASAEVTSLDVNGHPRWLRELLQSDRPICGRLTTEKRLAVFGDTGLELGSAALVPVPGFGLLAIGARDDQRFQSDMGTLFLEQLGQTVRFRLAEVEPERRIEETGSLSR
ncbi:MAG: DUF484 family protein [Wenzhouxiangellaceae bacterium]|nr:DUF484 family protein [Wenzhouxiangellaceae bacterium]